MSPVVVCGHFPRIGFTLRIGAPRGYKFCQKAITSCQTAGRALRRTTHRDKETGSVLVVFARRRKPHMPPTLPVTTQTDTVVQDQTTGVVGDLEYEGNTLVAGDAVNHGLGSN
jgi:hypothetical protein